MTHYEIEGSWMDLMRQASATASTYFSEALKTIEAQDERLEIPLIDRLRLAVDLAAIAERDYAASSKFIAARQISLAIRYAAETIRGDQ